MYHKAAYQFLDILLNKDLKRPKKEKIESIYRNWRNHDIDADELPEILVILEENEAIKINAKPKRKFGEKIFYIDRITSIELLSVNRAEEKSIEEEFEIRLPQKSRHEILRGIVLNRKNQIDDFIKLNQYLIGHDSLISDQKEITVIPVKERSLEIFGNEKYIDEKRKGDKLYGGQLKLEDIGCQIVSPPLILDNQTKDHKPILVLENFASYWSFCKLNALNPPQYSTVWYGDGNNFPNQHLLLDENIDSIENKDIFYLGDIDPHGIIMPTGANIKRINLGLQLIKPSLHYYRLMLEYGKEQDNSGKNIAESTKEDAIKAVKKWFSEDPELAERIIDIIDRNCRIPQECIGLKLLQQEGVFK